METRMIENGFSVSCSILDFSDELTVDRILPPNTDNAQAYDTSARAHVHCM